MGYPHGPQQGYDPYAGQGYVQPAYGGDPYGQQGYVPQPYGVPGPEYGYAAPAYGAPGYPVPGYSQPRAGGGTAITAALLSLLLSLVALGGMGIAAAVLFGSDAVSAAEDDARSAVSIGLAIGVVPGLLLLLGSILLFRRKTAGRVILIILSLIAVVMSAISIAAAIAGGAEEPAITLVGGAITTAPPLLILVLAAAPSTGRWIRAGRQPAYPPYPYH
ncbi:hypothetical protein ACFVAV_16935 [Nocardia sp. NPDC057663]|uniref:hypothetical protein n=1 Tax=Nocardia sp. NPDC057663 TaxID=3346201 RepID=UPI00366F26BB